MPRAKSVKVKQRGKSKAQLLLEEFSVNAFSPPPTHSIHEVENHKGMATLPSEIKEITPIALVEKMIDSTIVNNIITHSNDPSKSVLVDNNENKYHIKEWYSSTMTNDTKYIHINSNIISNTSNTKSTTIKDRYHYKQSDVFMYIASLFTGGISPQPAIIDYFNGEDIGILGNNWFKKYWTLNHLLTVHRNVRVNIADMHRVLNDNFKTMFSPGGVLTIDEHIMSFRGRFAYRTYIPTKPHSTGIKVYVMSDSSDYVYDFWVYTVCWLRK